MNTHGGAGRGQGRKPLGEELVAKTVSLFSRQVERLSRANLSEVVRRVLDEDERRQAKSYVTLWEDNAGGLWLVDTDRQMAYEVEGDGAFVEDAASLYADLFSTDGATVPYSEAIEPNDSTALVAEYDGEVALLYPGNMGAAAKGYCGVADYD